MNGILQLGRDVIGLQGHLVDGVTAAWLKHTVGFPDDLLLHPVRLHGQHGFAVDNSGGVVR
ncbi:hypothetical protein D3C72_2398320 [compost metagenome]